MSARVFYVTADDAAWARDRGRSEMTLAGWYWMPDASEPSDDRRPRGPFESAEAAHHDYQRAEGWAARHLYGAKPGECECERCQP